MNKFKALRIPSAQSKVNLYEVAFSQLVNELETPLFHELVGFQVQKLRDRYREILQDLGVQAGDQYRSTSLKKKLQEHFGSRISVLEQTTGAGFICASKVPLGDALEKLRHLGDDIDDKHDILLQAAKILRADGEKCKRETRDKHSAEISFTAAYDMIPSTL